MDQYTNLTNLIAKLNTWSQIYNINVATVRARLRTGDDIITALTKTVR